jgi:hypothetical protein
MSQKIVHAIDYATLRRENYPSLAEQMDMLWHAMNNGDLPKSEPFYSSIKDVKDRFAKDSGSEAQP